MNLVTGVRSVETNASQSCGMDSVQPLTVLIGCLVQPRLLINGSSTVVMSSSHVGSLGKLRQAFSWPLKLYVWLTISKAHEIDFFLP